MEIPYVIDGKQFAGRRVVIDIPPERERDYIACSRNEWDLSVDSSSLHCEQDFLWNLEQGRKVIYSSSIYRVSQQKPLDLNFSIPIWSTLQKEVLLNDKPFSKGPEYIHDYSGDRTNVLVGSICGQGTISFPVVTFSSKADNGFGIYIEIFAEVDKMTFPIWSKTIKLSDGAEVRKAVYKNRDYFVWDSCLKQDFAFDVSPSGAIADAPSGVNIGISVKFITTSEVYIGQKEDENAKIFRLDNFHYTMQFSDA